MKLQNPPGSYQPRYEIERNRALQQADGENHKKFQDVEIGHGRLILTDDTTGQRYEVYVDNGEFGIREVGGLAVSSDFAVRLAEAEILNSFGDTVSVSAKKKTLLKFGRNDDVGTTAETVWTLGGNETYVTTNSIDTISSSDAGDAEVIFVEGHTVSGTGASAEFTFVTQQATLNGQSKVVLGTPLARVSRAYVSTGNTLAGDVYVYEDTAISGGVPSDITKAHITIDGSAGDTQSFKCATTFSNTDYAIVTGGFTSVTKKTAGSADLQMEVRLPGGVFRPVAAISLDSDSQSTQQIQFNPYAIVPKNSDIRIVATGSTTGMEIYAAFQAYIAAVQ